MSQTEGELKWRQRDWVRFAAFTVLSGLVVAFLILPSLGTTGRRSIAGSRDVFVVVRFLPDGHEIEVFHSIDEIRLGLGEAEGASAQGEKRVVELHATWYDASVQVGGVDPPFVWWSIRPGLGERAGEVDLYESLRQGGALSAWQEEVIAFIDTELITGEAIDGVPVYDRVERGAGYWRLYGPVDLADRVTAWGNLLGVFGLWIAVSAVPAAVVTHSMVAFRVGRVRAKARAGICVGCGYDRRGLAGDSVCPECGQGPHPAA